MTDNVADLGVHSFLHVRTEIHGRHQLRTPVVVCAPVLCRQLVVAFVQRAVPGDGSLKGEETAEGKPFVKPTIRHLPTKPV